MSYKTVFVCLTTEEAAEQILPTASSIARGYAAHLVRLHTLQAIIPYPGIALHIDDPFFKEFNDRMSARDARIEAIFRT